LDTDHTDITDFSVKNGRKSVKSAESVYEKKTQVDTKKTLS